MRKKDKLLSYFNNVFLSFFLLQICRVG